MSKFRKWGLTVATMASVATVVLLVTGWGAAMAANVSSVFVTNTESNPVPVTPTGTVPVHEQGTANVNVTNTSVPVHDTNADANGNLKVHEQGTASVAVSGTASTISVDQTTLLESFEGSVPSGFTSHGVDITSARTIRVMTNCFVAACSNVIVRIYVIVGGRSYLNDEYSMTGNLLAQTHTYDVLGQSVDVQFVNQNSNPVDNVGLAVFGRSN